MQSGFGLLEAGVVSSKNEVNIMVKNAVDVVFGGITYWLYGYALSFGTGPLNNPFCGASYFLVDASHSDMGIVFSTYIFQLSFATTATTIVSGAMAERTRLSAYIIYSLLNTIVYVLPAHWLWGKDGWLNDLGAVDIAGSGAVHLLGGVSALVAAWMLKPRMGRYDNEDEPWPLGNPSNMMIGTFMLWWGWLAFNCGSTFGISGGKWKLSAKSAVTTINASVGGGAVGIIFTFVKTRKFMIPDIINSVLGALVGVTAGCAVVRPWEAIIIGAIGALLSLLAGPLLDKFHIDDPVGATAVHAVGGLWGMLAVGIFADFDPLEDMTKGNVGLIHGGGLKFFGIQLAASLAIMVWSAVTSFCLLFAIDKAVGIRMSEEEEELGADFVEHGIGQGRDILVVKEAPQPGTSDDRPVTAVSLGRHAFNLGRGSVVHLRTPSLQNVNKDNVVHIEVKPKDEGHVNKLFVNDDVNKDT
ncbi:putative ammonium transporter 3 [Tubulanus polymorphus]|uniref:putative ammonium transporter 3 n=1 Tax=Tubulanus polymorphus TaxID=672921 RepID=UPI003DA60141